MSEESSPKISESLPPENEVEAMLDDRAGVSEGERVSLTANDIGFILSGDFGPRTCPCGYCQRLAAKLQAMLQQTPAETRDAL